MDLTPDVQLEIVRVAEQWGAFLFIVVLILLVYRKEIGSLIMSLRRESNADALMGQMNASFAQNLEFFRQTVDDLGAIKASNQQIADRVDDAVEVLGAIKDELIRRGR